jgi:glutamate-ammonia-ligase adenylyltransferase
VRTPNTLRALECLAARGHVDDALAIEVGEAYAFLRRLIDALRVVRGNARDLTIPHTDTKAFAYLARRLELEPEALRTAIERHMHCAAALWPPSNARSKA